MKIATFNVNGITARLPALLRWLEESRPDIACLQELKAPHERFPETALRDAGYGVIWHGQKSWNGVAILARGRDPVERRGVLPGDPDDLHSRYIEATVGDILEVNFERPRTRKQLLEDPEYYRLREYLLHFLNERSHHRPGKAGQPALAHA